MALGRRIFVIAAMCALGISTFGALPSQALAQDKSTIRLGYVQGWPSSVVTTQLAAHVIEHKLDYPVELTNAATGLLYGAVASGELDAMLSAWLPDSQHVYYEKTWSDVLNLGPNLIGTRLGLVVPTYVDIDSIEDLNKHGDKFDQRIVGIDAGAGVMVNTKQAIKTYDLGLQLQSSSTAGMVAALERATERKNWIVVTGWAPLWIWGRFDLKFLDDPKNVYGQGGYVSTLASRELPTKAPAVYEFLDRFKLEMSALNAIEAQAKAMGAEGTQKAVAAWAQAHADKVNSWVAGIQAETATE